MTAAHGAPLGQAIEAWRRRQRVSYAHIARHAGIARNTLDQIRKGTTRAPDLATLRGIATGLATDPYPPGDCDHQLADRIYVELYTAAGYAPAGLLAGGDLLDTALYGVLGSTAKTRAWRAAIDRLQGLSVDEIERLGRGG